MVNALWTEKYRPRMLSEIRDQTSVVNRLAGFVKAKSMPHCLFSGPPGTGKTTASICLAHDLFKDNYREAYMELNASDTRGIDVIRTTVKEFARIAPIRELPFKILVLDEADNLTADAQHAMRRTMERFTETCRFILCCNYSSRIIEPIQSRCALFRFTPLSDDDVKECIQEIASKEDIAFEGEGLKAILQVSRGDLRKAINTLQAAASAGKKVTENIVYMVLGAAKPGEVESLIKFSLEGKLSEARTALRRMLFEEGVSGEEILKQIHRQIFSLDVKEEIKVPLIDYAGEVDYRITQGADAEVQLVSFLAKTYFTLSRSR
jgi:replication factor C small subunit